MRADRVIDHLGMAPAFSRCKDRVERLHLLQTLLEATLPAELLPGTRVAGIQQGRLVIHASSGAVAVKLRQLAPRLAATVQRQSPEISEIVVRVQPSAGNFFRSPPKKPVVLSPRAKRALTSLAAGLPEASSLRQALLRLLGRA
ncbi:MAG: DUF721 domain-containing protein [Rhodocyclaceae bacterium]|nr:DUF721 domain-containing protein [Rhodocyclaceae bacterium]